MIYEFRRQLTYKAIWKGKNVYAINRFEPSSKKCNNCKTIYKNLTLEERVWTCSKCKSVNNRDFNAAKNILDTGLNDLLILNKQIKYQIPKPPKKLIRGRKKKII